MNADYIADQAKADTILHELIHTVTAYADRCVEDGYEHLLDSDMVDAINELHSIFDAIKNDPTFEHDGVPAYGLTNVREMLSEAGSNSEFRNDLKKTNLWARLKAGFLQFFGIKQKSPSGSGKEVNAFEQIMERLEYLIENFKQEAWEEYYRGSRYGGYGYRKQDAQKIDTEDPMEAIGQAAESFREENDIRSVGSGDFGEIYDQFKGKAREAIQFLLKKRSGEATGALHHKDIGDIDLVWGEEGTGKSDGFGLAKLAKYHPEVLDNLQEILDDMHVVSRTENRINLESETHKAAVRLTWNEQKKKWLLTAFEKKNSALDNTTDTGKTSERGKRNDTATPQSTVSEGKDSNNSYSLQEKEEKSAKINTSDPMEAIKQAAEAFREERTLMGVHNISEDKLKKALKQVGWLILPWQCSTPGIMPKVAVGTDSGS